MGPVMSQFGLPADVTSAANTGDMQAFFKALESASGSESNKSQESDKKKDKPQGDKNDKKDGDAGMSME